MTNEKREMTNENTQFKKNNIVKDANIKRANRGTKRDKKS